MLKNMNDWRRVLIGLLLLLNSLPFSGGRVISTVPGVCFIICGWGVLSWPVIAEMFFGPADQERNFGLLDFIKVVVSACMMFFMVMIGNSEISTLCVCFLAIGVIIIFIPVDIILSLLILCDRAETLNILQYLYDNGFVSSTEYDRIKARICKAFEKYGDRMEQETYKRG